MKIKTTSTCLARLTVEIPALEVGQEGQLKGGFLTIAGMDALSINGNGQCSCDDGQCSCNKGQCSCDNTQCTCNKSQCTCNKGTCSTVTTPTDPVTSVTDVTTKDNGKLFGFSFVF